MERDEADVFTIGGDDDDEEQEVEEQPQAAGGETLKKEKEEEQEEAGAADFAYDSGELGSRERYYGVHSEDEEEEEGESRALRASMDSRELAALVAPESVAGPSWLNSLYVGASKAVKYCGPLLILALILYCWISFLVLFLAPLGSAASGAAAALGVPLHVLLVLLLWSMARAVFSDPGYVPHVYKQRYADMLEGAGLERDASEEAVAEVMGEQKWCKVCRCIKPPRSHHCRYCGCCVLRQDHHCPWTANCVAFRTQKFFLLFITYSWVGSTFIALSALGLLRDPFYHELLLKSVTSGSHMQIYVLPILTGVLGFGIAAFSAFQYLLLARNQTTVEALHQRQAENEYDMGVYTNVKTVLGPFPLLWCLPLWTTPGTGDDWSERGLLDV